jgi:hypothetical protein
MQPDLIRNLDGAIRAHYGARAATDAFFRPRYFRNFKTFLIHWPHAAPQNFFQARVFAQTARFAPLGDKLNLRHFSSKTILFNNYILIAREKSVKVKKFLQNC